MQSNFSQKGNGVSARRRVSLDEIIENKRREIAVMKIPAITRDRPLYSMTEFLRKRPFIAEIKRASPSRGLINDTVDIVLQAERYLQGGAGALSVLTDTVYFGGSFEYLRRISMNLDIPVLCKDFILSEVQIENAFLHGADAILLIAAILSREELKNLSGAARARGLGILYEVHDADEFHKLEGLDPEMVGVNSRDLTTFTINKKKASVVLQGLSGPFVKIAESGIESADDIRLFKEAGADAFLVGTALMSTADPIEKLAEFYAALGRKAEHAQEEAG